MESDGHVRTGSTSDEEKVVASAPIHSDLPADPDAHLSDAERKSIDRKLVWKLDLYLIPWVRLKQWLPSQSKC